MLQLHYKVLLTLLQLSIVLDQEVVLWEHKNVHMIKIVPFHLMLFIEVVTHLLTG